MQATTLHANQTREPIGIVLSIRPKFWAELDDEPTWHNPATCDTRSHRDDTDWTQLFGLEE